MPRGQYGDYQTPDSLAGKVVELAGKLSHLPETIIEPTCGAGSLVRAALSAHPQSVVHGLEVQRHYVQGLKDRFGSESRFFLHQGDYFTFDWASLINACSKPLWIVGNPPWVTNSYLSDIGSSNLPEKFPQDGLTGFEAQTGKSNFDISESMLRDWMQWAHSCNGTVSVICKQSVARKILLWWWKKGEQSPSTRLHLIDAKREFNATVSACILVCSFALSGCEKACDVYASPADIVPTHRFAFIDGILVSNELAYREGRNLIGTANPRWRSGIKHDAKAALELRRTESGVRTVDGLLLDVEEERLYPMMKGSDLNSSPPSIYREMLIPQHSIRELTDRLKTGAPKTYSYLLSQSAIFEKRKSTIYKKGGRFSIFGVGEYTFLPWKVAIGALYKQLRFTLVGPRGGKPVVFDDTIYFAAFLSEAEAREAHEWLNSREVMEILNSMIFWDDMRPIKIDILNRITLPAIAHSSCGLRANGSSRESGEETSIG